MFNILLIIFVSLLCVFYKQIIDCYNYTTNKIENINKIKSLMKSIRGRSVRC